MIGDHPSFQHPTNRDIQLWRYMDLSKFIDCLQTGNLYFSRADKLGDPFEGSITRLDAALWQFIIRYRDTVEELAQWRGLAEQQIRALAEELSDGNRRSVGWFYISCWHMNEHESAAMWKLYSQSSDAICIQSTFHKLDNELPDFVYAGSVEYLDYETQIIPRGNIFDRFLRKRKSFEHERELRAVLMFPADADQWPHPVGAFKGEGVIIPVSLSSMVERIFVSPTSTTWFKSVVEGIVAKYDLEVPVVQSSLAATPLY